MLGRWAQVLGCHRSGRFARQALLRTLGQTLILSEEAWSVPPPNVFVCQGCGRDCPRQARRGRRLQSFCGRPGCQHRRKALWQREKLAQDPKYRAEQREAQSYWSRKRPGYWRQYRKQNAAAAERNRSAQRRRDRQRRARGAAREAGDAAVGRLAQSGRGEVPAGHYVLQPIGVNAGEHWEVVVLPADRANDVLAKMDASNGIKALV